MAESAGGIDDLKAQVTAIRRRKVVWSETLERLETELKRRRNATRAAKEEPPPQPRPEPLAMADEQEAPLGRLPRRMRFSEGVEPDGEDEALPSTEQVARAAEPKEEDDMTEGVATAERLEEAQADVTEAQGRLADAESELAEQQAAEDERRIAEAMVEQQATFTEAIQQYQRARGELTAALLTVAERVDSLARLREALRRVVGQSQKIGGTLDGAAPVIYGSTPEERNALQLGRSAAATLGRI